MNNLQQPETATEEDLIATQTMDRAETWNIYKNADITRSPETKYTSELEEARQAVVKIIATLLVVSALEGWTVEEQKTFVEADVNDLDGQSEENPTIGVQVMPLNSLEEEEYANAA